MKYSKKTIEDVANADIRDYVPGCNRAKANQDITCPFCGADCFSVVHKSGKNFAHCHKCDQGYTSPIDYMMKAKGMQFIEAVEAVAS
jgi:transcription elongation factor Elf1